MPRGAWRWGLQIRKERAAVDAAGDGALAGGQAGAAVGVVCVGSGAGRDGAGGVVHGGVTSWDRRQEWAAERGRGWKAWTHDGVTNGGSRCPSVA